MKPLAPSRPPTQPLRPSPAPTQPMPTPVQPQLPLAQVELQGQQPRAGSAGLPSVAIVSTTAQSSLKVLEQWIGYHRVVGVEHFYLFLEMGAMTLAPKLRELPGVAVWVLDAEHERTLNTFMSKNESFLRPFLGKPCNWALMLRQNYNVDIAIEKAFSMGLDWLVHVDTDELLYPGGSPDYSMRQVLGNVGENTTFVVFPNYEALPETDGIVDPFSEVTLFKKARDHTSPEARKKYARNSMMGNPGYFLLYMNGKSAARLVPGIRASGVHRFFLPQKSLRKSLRRKAVVEKHSEAAVLHFTYTRFADMTSKAGMCNCPLDEQSLKTCFVLEFDRQVYVQLHSPEKNDTVLREWYRQRVVWDHTKPIKATNIKYGLFQRIFAPQTIIRCLLTR